jgi:hypothetical protein
MYASIFGNGDGIYYIFATNQRRQVKKLDKRLFKLYVTLKCFVILIGGQKPDKVTG